MNQLPAQPSDNFDKRQLMESEGIKGVGLLHAHTHTVPALAHQLQCSFSLQNHLYKFLRYLATCKMWRQMHHLLIMKPTVLANLDHTHWSQHTNRNDTALFCIVEMNGIRLIVVIINRCVTLDSVSVYNYVSRSNLAHTQQCWPWL